MFGGGGGEKEDSSSHPGRGMLTCAWQAGEDKEWLKGNVKAFEKRAEAGDGEFADVLEEMRTREDLRELL